jgi:hypothetical protein
MPKLTVGCSASGRRILISVRKKTADNISWSSIRTHNTHGKGCLRQKAGSEVERHKLSHPTTLLDVYGLAM